MIYLPGDRVVILPGNPNAGWSGRVLGFDPGDAMGLPPQYLVLAGGVELWVFPERLAPDNGFRVGDRVVVHDKPRHAGDGWADERGVVTDLLGNGELLVTLEGEGDVQVSPAYVNHRSRLKGLLVSIFGR